MISPENVALISGITASVIQLDKRFGVHLTHLVPAGWRWCVPVAIAALLAASNGLSSGASWREIVVLAIGSAVGAMGVDAGLAESRLPWSGKPEAK